MNESLSGRVTLEDLFSKVFVKEDSCKIVELNDEDVNVKELESMYYRFIINYYPIFCETYGISRQSYISGKLSKSELANRDILYHDANVFYKSLLHVLEKYNYENAFDEFLLEKATSEIIEPAVSKRRLSIALGLPCAMIFFGCGTLFIVAFVKKLSFMLHNLNIHNALIAYKICGPVCFAIAIATTIIALIYIARNTRTINDLNLQIKNKTYCSLLSEDNLKILEERLETEFHYQIESRA
jgi:uncharacterized membrane protein (DUF485 family)